MELPELHVFQRNASAGCHAHAVTSVDKRVGGCIPDAACTTGGKHGGFGFQHHHLAGFHFQGGYTHHVTVGITNNVKRHPLYEELGARAYVALVQSVQQGVTCAVGSRASALNRLFTEVGCVATKWALINGAIWVAVKGHAKVFKLVNHFGRFTTHEFDCILVSQIVRTFHGVEHVPVPAVVGHIAQRRADTTLRSHGV